MKLSEHYSIELLEFGDGPWHVSFFRVAKTIATSVGQMASFSGVIRVVIQHLPLYVCIQPIHLDFRFHPIKADCFKPQIFQTGPIPSKNPSASWQVAHSPRDRGVDHPCGIAMIDRSRRTNTAQRCRFPRGKEISWMDIMMSRVGPWRCREIYHTKNQG